MKFSTTIARLANISFVFPLLIFCLFLGYFAADVPQGDDFELILHFLTNYVSTQSLGEKLSLLTAQFVEHRLFYTRFVVLLQYLVSGKVSFYWIIILGNLSLLGILVICWRQLKLAHYSTIYLLPVSIILFQPCYSYDGVLWPAATLAYNSVSFFAILTIHWLSSRQQKHLWWALGSALMCTYTFGNGIVILGVGAGLLIAQKRWKDLSIWALGALVIAIVYFTNYTKFENRNNPFNNITQHFRYVVTNLLVFLGSALNWSEEWPKKLTASDVASILAGGFILICFGYLVVRLLKSYFKTPINEKPSHPNRFFDFQIGSLGFFVLTGFLLCLSRVDKDEILMHINRYRIHSVAGLVLGYFCLLPFLAKQKLFFRGFVGALGIFWLISFFHFYKIFAEYSRSYTSAQHNWVSTHQWFIYRDTSYWEEASKLAMDKAEKALQYRITKSPFDIVAEKATVFPHFKMEQSPTDKILKISSDVPRLSLKEDYYIAFRNLSQSQTYLVPAVYNRRSIRLVMMGNDYYYPHFNLELTYRHFPTGKYQVGVAHVVNNSLEIQWQPAYFDAVQESNFTH
ncbi:hypothetical protein P1X15_28535 [Runella sp. MFBS21]|uniref:hypothetical protein n=1 Tax=Runella sp. MFBS21 TaxID=3034018 RepID=UPI0023F6553F|nr:hypothetical protein [Runella sp. MFBS21]MDF7821600.1 hypothetical protein [Runella sp. MFBS21]